MNFSIAKPQVEITIHTVTRWDCQDDLYRSIVLQNPTSLTDTTNNAPILGLMKFL